jgi:hypothetical protein
MKIEEIKTKQLLDLKQQCEKNGVSFDSVVKLLNSEKIKKLSKRNQYIQQTINSEIEKSLDHENNR